LKTDAGWCIEAIRARIRIAMKNLQRADKCQAIMRGTLHENTSPIPPTWLLVEQVKEMLDHTHTLKSAAKIMHEHALHLDKTLTQLKALEKEEHEKCKTS
ncbi:MAG: hypothetical protein E7I00_03320, partial [Varibaculum cambriense]|nr:hypothetical protein [Varibaculum cambriense]